MRKTNKLQAYSKKFSIKKVCCYSGNAAADKFPTSSICFSPFSPYSLAVTFLHSFSVTSLPKNSPLFKFHILQILLIQKEEPSGYFVSSLYPAFNSITGSAPLSRIKDAVSPSLASNLLHANVKVTSTQM